MTQTEDKLRQVVMHVFRRLPEPHQAVIRQYPMRVVVKELPNLDGRLEAAHAFAEIAGDIITNVIELDKEVAGKIDDAVLAYLIAHEFAHLSLGHALFLTYGEKQGRYSEDELRGIRQVFEEEADFWTMMFYGYEAEAVVASQKIGATSSYLARRSMEVSNK